MMVSIKLIEQFQNSFTRFDVSDDAGKAQLGELIGKLGFELVNHHKTAKVRLFDPAPSTPRQRKNGNDHVLPNTPSRPLPTSSPEPEPESKVRHRCPSFSGRNE